MQITFGQNSCTKGGLKDWYIKPYFYKILFVEGLWEIVENSRLDYTWTKKPARHLDKRTQIVIIIKYSGRC